MDRKDKSKSAKTTAPNLQSGSSITNSNSVILGQTLNDVITYIKDIFKPQEKLFQSKPYNNPDQLKFDFDSLMTQQAKQQQLIFQSESVSGQSVQNEIKKIQTEYIKLSLF